MGSESVGETMDALGVEALEKINLIVGLVTVGLMWCIVRPQAIENRTLHKAIDNNTAALEKLTELVNDINNEMSKYGERIKTLEREVLELRRQRLNNG